MLGSSNTSFIPKRNPALKERTGGKRQVYVGTIIVRVLFVAVLIATAAVFLYERKLQSTLDSEVVALSTAISSFNEVEMQRVLEAEKRIKQANERMSHTASMIALLRAIESSTVGSAQITGLTLERQSDERIEIAAEIETTSFDSVLFQRNILENSPTLTVEEVTDLVIDNPPPDSALFESERVNREIGEVATVGFQAVIAVNPEAIAHTVSPQAVNTPTTVPSEPVSVPEVVASSTEAVDVAPVSNEETI